ncbi:hypothetical protein BDV3_000792 [Batrachochytrium dendrobatidis]|uniref:Spindle assembly checkpoint component MAD1 n=1 Tax=Batrachochytrium dendrobatidis (strain JEL423) TaxID=403673 RepID=A0A177W943_BATDL|nr:hypothetical protein BDEG_20346 [Batrachochytrium dendrobatidis JEL423]
MDRKPNVSIDNDSFTETTPQRQQFDLHTPSSRLLHSSATRSFGNTQGLFHRTTASQGTKTPIGLRYGVRHSVKPSVGTHQTTGMMSSSKADSASVQLETCNPALNSFYNFLAVADSGSPKVSQSKSPTKTDSPTTRKRAASPIQDQSIVQTSQKEIKRLERLLASTKSTYMAKLIEAERDRDRLETELSDATIRHERLDSDRSFLFSRDTDLSERIEKLQKELIETKSLRNQEIHRLDDEIRELKESWQLDKDTNEINISTVKAELDQKRIIADSLMLQLEVAQQQILEQKQLIDDAQTQKKEYELKLSGLHSSNLTKQSIGSMKENKDADAILYKQLAEQTTYIRQLEKKVAQQADQISFHKAIQENTERLKEENTALQQQIESLSVVRMQLSEARVALTNMESEKARWQSFINDVGTDLGIDSPYALAKLISSQRTEIASLKTQVGEHTIHARKAYTKQLEHEIEEMHKEIDLLKFARQEDSNVLRRTEASNQLLQKQITSLQAQLKSYDLEEQSMMKSYDIQKSHRIADLELLIVDYRTRNEMLELELKAQSQSIVQSQLQQHVKREYAQDDTFHLDQEMATLKNANEMLKTEVNSLEIQVGVLQHAIGRGEYDPTTTRIVMLADNPESKAALDRNQIHEAMAAENKELRMRLEQVGGACMPSRSACADEPQSGMIPIESLHTKEIQCNQLQEELDGCNKRMTRLKEVFGTKIQEFREAVYILLGFKVEIQIDGQVRVASMYAHSIDDPVLLFTSATNPQIELQLVGGTNESRNALHQNVQMYLEQHRSIPALLAATTLNWFERSNKLSN